MTTNNRKSIYRILDRVSALLDIKNEKSRSSIALLAIGIFLVGLIFSFRRLDASIAWRLSTTILLGMLALLCLTFLINTLRTHTHSRIVGAQLSLGDNAKISLFASAMNMLPMIIPAGMAMRMSNFVRHGGDAKLVVGVLVTNYVLALLSSLLLGIAMLASNSFAQLQIPLVLIAFVYIGVAALFIRLSGLKAGLGIALLELSAVIVDAIRIYICFGILSFSIEYFQAAILTVSAVLGSAVSIVPAGLGVREIVGAMISPLIEVVPEQTFLAIALNRVFGILFFVGLSGLVLFIDRSKQR